MRLPRRDFVSPRNDGVSLDCDAVPVMTRTILAVLLFIFCVALPAQATWLDSNWTKRVKLTIDADKVNGDLANFPVFVDLNGMPASFFTTIKDNGADLRVTKTDGSSEVPFELVYLDTSNGAGELHFQANGTLSGTSNSDWYLYYGYNGASAYARDDTYGSENVWTQGYVAVYHLNEEGNTTAGGYKDSTLYNHHANGVSLTPASDMAGKLGSAQYFDGVADYISISNSDVLDMSGGNGITISLWAKRNAAGIWDPLVSKGESMSASHAHDYNFGIRDNDRMRFTASGPGFVARIEAGGTPIDGTDWTYWVATWTGDTFANGIKIYRDGVLIEDGTASGSQTTVSTSHNWYIGGKVWFWSGLEDEVHFSPSARSAEWIWTEYQNQNSPNTFYTIGSEEILILNNYTWTGNSDASTWADQVNWDIGDGTAGNDGYPDDSLDIAIINSTIHNITTSTDLSLGGLTMNGTYSGTLSLGSKLTVGSSGINLYNGTLITAKDTNGDISIAGDLLIDNGATLRVRRSSTVGNGVGQAIMADNIIINAGGIVTAIGEGFDAGAGPGNGYNGTYGDGASHGGIGGPGQNADSGTRVSYGSYLAPTSLGSSTSFKGGGAIQLIVSETLVNNGLISVSAVQSGYRHPGAAGGSLYVITADIRGDGQISADGNIDTGHQYPGGGGGGRVAIVLTNGTSFSAYSGAMTAYGGDASLSLRDGSAGTIYKETALDASGQGTLLISNNNLSLHPSSTTLVPQGETWSIYNLELSDAGVIGVANGSTLDLKTTNINSDLDTYNDGIRINGGILKVSAPSLFINGWSLIVDGTASYAADTTLINNGTITHSDNSITEEYKADLSINGNLTITNTGYVNVNKKGYDGSSINSYGPGKGRYGSYGDGASHGGLGGVGTSGGATRVVYGSCTSPVTLGSGAGSSGGGAVKLTITGTLTNNGTISADADSISSNYGGAAGGSVYLTVSDIAGNGSISADGKLGSTHGYPGGGGGGRIALILTNGNSFINYTGSITAYGGNASGVSRDGSAGTIYKQIASDASNGGVLTIANFSGASTASSTYTEIDTINPSTLELGSILINGDTIFKIASDDTLNLIGNGTTVTIETGGQLINNGSMLINGSAFSVLGTFTSTASTSSVEFRGEQDSADDAIAITDLGISFYDLTINGSESNDTFILGSNLDVNGDLKLSGAGDFSPDTYTINLAGNWSNTASFSSGTSTVIFDGSSQSITGDTSFYNFTKIEGADDSTNEVLTFGADDTFYITGNLILDGRDADDMISLVSDSPGTQWKVSPSVRSVDYVSITDSRNIHSLIYCTNNCSDGGNNTAWVFGDIGQNWYDEDWRYRIKLTIEDEYVNGNLHNFPVFVDLNGFPAHFFSNLISNGADLRVTKGDGSTEVAREVVSVDTNNGLGEMYFVANGYLSSSENGYFYIYYGNSSVSNYVDSDTYGAQNVWIQDYVAVYHMNEDGNTTADGYKDSTVHINHLDGVSMTNDSDSIGKIGRAQYFDGSSDRLVNSSTSSMNFGDVSISSWSNTSKDYTSIGIMVHLEGSGNIYDEIRLELSTADKANLVVRDMFHTSGSVTTSDDIFNDGDWHYYAGSIDRDSATGQNLYVDGVLLKTSDPNVQSGSVNNSTIVIGGDASVARFDGLIDEVRISNTARSAEWIWTEYQNQSSPTSFYSVSAYETGGRVNHSIFMMGGY